MSILDLFRPKPRPREIVRASTKAQIDARETYAATHAVLAQELGKPVPAHLRGYQPTRRAGR